MMLRILEIPQIASNHVVMITAISTSLSLKPWNIYGMKTKTHLKFFRGLEENQAKYSQKVKLQLK